MGTLRAFVRVCDGTGEPAGLTSFCYEVPVACDSSTMRVVELRRHSVRSLPEESLSPGGVALARTIGKQNRSFHLAVTSPTTRAVETAVALGYPSARLNARWGPFPDSVPLKFHWLSSFPEVKAAFQREHPMRHYASNLLALIRISLAEIPDRGALVIVTHGGVPELGAVSTFPESDPTPLGGPLRCMEGVRIAFEEQSPKGLEVLRVPDEQTRI